MARIIGPDDRGITIELSHDETNNLLATMAGAAGAVGTGAAKIATLLVTFGLSAAAAPYIAAAIAMHLTWETLVIKASDWGHGVYLFATREMLFGMPGVVLAYARTADETDWPAADGEIKSGRNDVIAYRVATGGGDPGSVTWHLTNHSSSGWTKGVVVNADGQEFPIFCDAGVTNDNYTSQQQAQQAMIVFSKPGWLGRWEDVLTIYGRPDLRLGDLVEFTWTQD